MPSSKKESDKRRGRRKVRNDNVSDNFRSFKSLFPVIVSPQGMKPGALKNLYRLLVILSSEAQWSIKYGVGSHDFDLEMCHNGINVTFGDISEVSNVLFKELEERFEGCFSTLSDFSANRDFQESSTLLDFYTDVEVVSLLFRCCLLLLTLLAAKVNLMVEKGQILLRILTKLNLPILVRKTGKSSFIYEKSVFRECPLTDNGCTASSAEDFTASLHFLEPHNCLLFFMSTVLEVFVDELLVHEQIKGYFGKLISVAYTNDLSFYPHSAKGGISVIVEAICNHFILTFSDKQAFGDFLSRLFCSHSKNLRYPFRAPGISVTAAVSLLLSPIMNSVPKFMQAHLIALVSEATDSVTNFKSLKPDHKLINCFLSSFEKSVTLYMTHMSWLQLDGYPASTRCSAKFSTSHKISYSSFETYISSDMKNRVYSLINELDYSSNPNLHESFSRMRSDLVSSSMRFVKECQNVYGIFCQDKIMSILSCLILKASENIDDTANHQIEGTTLQRIYLLASVLKLMSISLLQAVRCLRHSDDFCCQKTLKDFSLCKEYDFIVEVITCFRDLDISLPLQQVLSNIMSSHSTRHMDSKMMFLHFSGLMSLSFASGLDCLVKGCLLIILALLNLFVFEEGSLDALRSIIDSNTESFSSRPPVVRLQEAVVDQNSGLVVAAKFQKIRSLHLSVREKKNNEKRTLSSETLSSALDMERVAPLEEILEEETEETSNGEIFFNCLSNMERKVSHFDDLVGFVECKKQKDYPSWLNNRQRYRRQRLEKMAVLRWKRKKTFWRTLKGKKSA